MQSTTVYTVCTLLLIIDGTDGLLLSLNKNITKSSEFPTGRSFGDGSANKAVDGNKDRVPDNCQCCAVTDHTTNTWFRLDLGKDFIIQHLEILGREEPIGLFQSFLDMNISLIDDNSTITYQETIPDIVYVVNRSLSPPVVARYVNMHIPQKGHFTLCEISVYGDCVDGRFGDDCETICHCKEGPCNKSTGICPAGGCKSGYFGETCSKGLLLSLNKNMTKSSEFPGDVTIFGTGTADKAVDGIKDRKPDVCKCCAGTGHTTNTWFKLDLGKDFIIQHLEILGREEPPVLYQSFQNMTISLIDESSKITYQERIPDKVYVVNRSLWPPVVARYVNMHIPQKGHFTLCEISVYGDCVDGRFGDDCDTICHCKEGPCNKTTGVCPAGGCKGGYFGETCSTGLLLSLNKNMTKSSAFPLGRSIGDGSAYKAVDGNKGRVPEDCKCCAATNHTPDTWFRLDLGKEFIIQHLEILGREKPPGLYESFQNMNISLIDESSTITYQETIPDRVYVVNRSLSPPVVARYINMQIPQKGHFTLCEISVYGDCVDGRFGDDCDTICHCKNGPCSKTTGICPAGGCKSGYFGETCSTGCVDGRYGDDCDTICHCKNGPCNKTTGICPAGDCKSGYFGESCSTECKNRTYGENCTAYCGNCLNNAPCDTKTGHCDECGPGYVGAFCKQECEDGYYGVGCGGICVYCLNGVACNKVDGHCQLCPPGLHGVYCDEECPDGYFGLNCSGRCHCNGGSCNTVTGECPGPCAPGYAGQTCNSVCAHGTFGQNCTAECGLCADNMTCHHEDGTCNGCISGYLTDFCNLTCPSGMYGLNCAKRCSEHCYDDTICDFRTGICDLGCDPGYTSKDCNTECDDNHYGRNCEESCGSCSNGTCDKKDGHCMACLDGFTLPLCKQDDKSNAEIWPVIVGVIGAVSGISTICILLFVYIKRRRNNQTNTNSSDILNNRQRTKISYNEEDSTDDMIKIDKEGPAKYHTEMKTKENADVKQTGMYLNVSFTHAAKQNAKVNMSDSISAHHSGLEIYKLWNYIVDMKRKNCKKFYQEFELLQAGPLHPHKIALQHPSQNCYRGIYAYDHNRVPLTVDKPDESEYINASFVNGFEKEKKFIACQGPSRETAKQFWQMIWQYNCKQILILTNLVETGKDKYAKYWAEEHEVTFGSITIKPGTFEKMKDYDIRTFRISKNGMPAQSVTQYHFKAWQEKDVPDSPWSLVSFWLRVTKDMVVKADVGPVVVHCSAGVGRTGLFIALDFLYNQGKTDGCLTPFQAVAALREQRPFMVQTKEQYVFLHEAVAESLLLGTHGILVDQIQDVYSYLLENDPVTNLSRMYMQFQLIIDSTENYENDGVYANDNEYFDMDMGMQHITSDETSFTRNLGTVFTTDYKGKQSFIIAPIPNSATMEMFWSLVRDKNVKTVVIVTDTTSPNYKQYLSKTGKEETDSSRVSMLEEKTTYHYIERQFQYTGKKVARGTVRLIEYTKWTDSRDVPGDRGSMIALLDHVLECQECCSDKEPILILCTTGHLKSGVICALLNEFYRIENDRGHINIIETVKLLKEKERLAIKSFEQYQYIYDVLLAKLCGEKLYENM